jgi:putative endonuclease
MASWKWYVYIIECKDESYYVGCTWSPAVRAEQHASGFGGKYTAQHGFKKVVYLEEYENLEEARLREKQLKGWTRAKKLKLIEGIWTKL